LGEGAFKSAKKFADERGVCFTAIDLRWGITEEQSRSKKVLEICLREIDRAQPYFVGLIGNRYGWQPTFEEVDGEQLVEKVEYAWIHEATDEGLSITEMEMAYGVFMREKRNRAFFFVQKSAHKQDDAGSKLSRLKEKIMAGGILVETMRFAEIDIPEDKFGYTFYETVEELNSKMEELMKSLIDRDFPEVEMTPREKLNDFQTHIIRKHTQHFIDSIETEGVIAVLDENLTLWDNADQLLLLFDRGGSGKSALLAEWIKRRSNDFELPVLYYFLQNNPFAGVYHHFMHYFVLEDVVDTFQLREVVAGKEYQRLEDQWEDLYPHLHDKQVLLVVDGIDQFTPGEQVEMKTQLERMAAMMPKLKIIASVSSAEGWRAFGIRDEELPEDSRWGGLWCDVWRDRQIDVFIAKYLRQFGKRLSDEQMKMIADWYREGATKKELVMLLDELVLHGDFKTLTSYISYYIDGLYSGIIEHYEGIYGRDFVRKILLPLQLRSSVGMSEEEILAIAKVSRYEWTEFYHSFQNYIDRVGGRFIWSIPVNYTSELLVDREDTDSWQMFAVREIVTGLTPCVCDFSWDGKTSENYTFYIGRKCITELQYNAVMGIDEMGSDKGIAGLTKFEIWDFIERLRELTQMSSNIRLATANEYYSAGFRGLLERQDDDDCGVVFWEAYINDELSPTPPDYDPEGYLYLACISL